MDFLCGLSDGGVGDVGAAFDHEFVPDDERHGVAASGGTPDGAGAELAAVTLRHEAAVQPRTLHLRTVVHYLLGQVHDHVLQVVLLPCQQKAISARMSALTQALKTYLALWTGREG